MAESDIAVVGVAAHLPGALDPAAYWRNLVSGHESVRQLIDMLCERFGPSGRRP